MTEDNNNINGEMEAQGQKLPTFLENLRAEMEAGEEPQPIEETAVELLKEGKAKELRKITAEYAVSKWLQAVRNSTSDEIDLQLLELHRMGTEFAEAVYGNEEEDLYEKTKNKTLEEEKAEREAHQPAIKTDFCFYVEAEGEEGKPRIIKEQLTLPAGAITLVCAPTGHGKTRLLVNFAMQALQHGSQEGVLLYFSVEENAYAIKDRFLNYYINKRLSHYNNNADTISEYKSEKDPDKQRALFDEIGYDKYMEEEQAFQDKYITPDRLRIIYEETRSVDMIAQAVHDIAKHKPITAIFIDYIQRLQKKGNYNSNAKELLKAVTNDLMSLSIEMQVPMVIAVQFNRDVYSPLEMDLQNIAEASEIEFAANRALLCWNSTKKPQAKNSKWNTTKKTAEGASTELTLSAKEFEEHTGMTIGKESMNYKIYMKRAKSRNGMDLECVLDVAGNTGVMTPAKFSLSEKWEEQERRHQESMRQKNGNQLNLTGGGIEKHDYIDPNGSGETPTKQGHTSKSFSQTRREKYARLKAEKKAQAEAPADTEETAQPQQEVTIADLKADLDRRIEQMEAKQDETATPSEPEDPTNVIGSTEIDSVPF